MSENLARPFKDLRLTRFADVAADMARDLDYVEQLAMQTSTRIDEWPILEILKDAPRGDRRAINKAFFGYTPPVKAETPKVVIPKDAEKVFEDVSKTHDLAKTNRIRELNTQAERDLNQSIEHTKRAETSRKQAWDKWKEVAALEDRPANYIANEVRRLLTEGFWKFESYTDGWLKLSTINDIVMSEINPSAGINRRVNMGKFIGALRVKDAAMRVWKFRNNVLTKGGSNYHPYVNYEGFICWGNAEATASRLLATGQVYEAYMLLGSLLGTYSPDSTPYARLMTFEGGKIVPKTSRPPSGASSWCDEHDEERESCGCDWCEECANHVDDCECGSEDEEEINDDSSPFEPTF